MAEASGDVALAAEKAFALYWPRDLELNCVVDMAILYGYDINAFCETSMLPINDSNTEL